MKIAIAAAILGLIFGLLGGPVWVLIPWALASIVIGYFSKVRKSALINGAVFAFITSFAFLLRGYNGAMPVYTKFPGFFALSLFGALCGTIAGFVGYIIYKGVKKNKSGQRNL